MNQSGKIIAYVCAYVCTALSAAAMLGVSILVIGAPWIGLGPSSAQSVQAKTSADAAGKQLAEVRALVVTVSGAPSETPQAGTAAAVEAAAPPPEWSPVEVGAALMQCVSLLAPISAEVIPLAPVRFLLLFVRADSAALRLYFLHCGGCVRGDPHRRRRCSCAASVARTESRSILLSS